MTTNMRILLFIQTYTEVRGCAPTIKEIAAHVGYASVNTIWWRLKTLERKGLIVRKPFGGRAIGLVKPIARVL